MDATTLLEVLVSRGAVLTLAGATLYVEPPDVLNDELRAKIRQHKPELIELLRVLTPIEVPSAPDEEPTARFCLSGRSFESSEGRQGIADAAQAPRGNSNGRHKRPNK